MSDITKFKLPIQGAAILGINSNNLYTPIQVDDSVNGIRVIPFVNDGNTKVEIKSNQEGRLEVLPGYDGTSYKPLSLNADGSLKSYIVNTSINVNVINQSINVNAGYDGTSYVPIPVQNGSIPVNVVNNTLNKPVSKANLFNTTITDSQNILPNDIYSSDPPSVFVIYIAVGANSTLRVKRTLGGNTVIETLGQLTSKTAQLFEIIVDDNEGINFDLVIDGSGTTTTTLLKMSVVEKFNL